jgi:hypothetical protein
MLGSLRRCPPAQRCSVDQVDVSRFVIASGATSIEHGATALANARRCPNSQPCKLFRRRAEPHCVTFNSFDQTSSNFSRFRFRVVARRHRAREQGPGKPHDDERLRDRLLETQLPAKTWPRSPIPKSPITRAGECVHA